MEFLTLFLKINFLLSLSGITILILQRLSAVRFLKFSYLYRLQISYFLILMSLSLPIVVPHLSIHVGDTKADLLDLPSSGSTKFWAVAVSNIKSSFSLNDSYTSLLGNAFIALAVLGIAIFLFQIAVLIRKSKSLKISKRIGSVYLAIQPEEAAPYVFSLSKRKFVVLPQYLLADQQLLKIAVKHELQHIRQQDTRWIYLLNFVLLCFYVNPFVHLLIRNIKNTQELACDEELLINKKVKFKSYIQSLLKIAELVQERKSAPFFANTILREGNKSNLRERVEMMIKVRKNRNKGYLAGLVLFVSFLILGTSAYAVKDLEPTARKKQILFTMVLMEEGKVVSRPKVLGLEGEAAIVAISDGNGQGQRVSVIGWVYGDRIEMRLERSVVTNHIAGKSEEFNVEVRNNVTWSMDYQQDGRNLSLELTPTLK